MENQLTKPDIKDLIKIIEVSVGKMGWCEQDLEYVKQRYDKLIMIYNSMESSNDSANLQYD